MGTDIRKHTAPLAGETPSRQVINDLSLTVNDVIPIANTTARAQLVVDLTAAGFTPSQTKPLYVHRADAGAGLELEVSTDGTTWRTIASSVWTAYTPTVSGVSLGSGTVTATWRREGGLIRVRPKLVWGGGASGSSPKITLPVTSATPTAPFQALGLATITTASSGAIYAGAFTHLNTTTAQINYFGTNGLLTDITLSAPGVPAVGDSISGEFTYIPA